MKVSLERSGGFAGITTNINIDTKDLLPEESHQLHDIIHNADFFNLPSKSGSPTKGSADYFTYKITIQDNDRKHTVEYTDTTPQLSIKPLVDFLLKNSQRWKKGTINHKENE